MTEYLQKHFHFVIFYMIAMAKYVKVDSRVYV